MSLHIWKWIKGWFPKGTFKTKIAPAIVTILEGAKGLLDTPLFATVEKVLDGLTGHLSTTVIDALKKELPKAIAVFLGVEGLPDNATEQQIADFEKTILEAILSKAETLAHGEIYTRLGAHIFITFQKLINDAKVTGEPVTFAQIVNAVEDAYQAYLQYKADAENADNTNP